MRSTEVLTFPPRSASSVSLTVELRWGINETDLPILRELHLASFPVRFDNDYYDWLLSDGCIALVAYRVAQSEVSTAEATFETEEEEKKEEENEKNTSAAAASSSSSSLGCVFSVPIGFCIGQLGYARRRDGTILAAPTGYIGTFAVLKDIRQSGLGHTLLQRFLWYMFVHVPVPRMAFLDTPRALDGKGGKESEEELGLRGVAEVWLHCLADHTELVQYYRRRGFHRVHRSPNYYLFDNAYHDSMLLVCCRRECNVGVACESDGHPHRNDLDRHACKEMHRQVKKSTVRGHLTAALGQTGDFDRETELGQTLRNAEEVRGQVQYEASCLSELLDIVDIDIRGELSELREEWRGNGKDVFLNSWEFIWRHFLFISNIGLFTAGAVWLAVMMTS